MSASFKDVLVNIAKSRLRFNQVPTLVRGLDLIADMSIKGGATPSDLISVFGSNKQKETYLRIMESTKLVRRNDWKDSQRNLSGRKPVCYYELTERGKEFLALAKSSSYVMMKFLNEDHTNQGNDYP